MRSLRALLVLSLVGAGLANAQADEPDALAKVADRAAADFSTRLAAATKELGETRERIAKEKTPLLDASRAAEDQVLALGPEIADLQAGASEAAARRKQLQGERFALQRNINYLDSLARDSLKSAEDGLLPGEAEPAGPKAAAITAALDKSGEPADPGAAVDAIEFMLQRFRTQLGGHLAPGSSLVGEGNKMVPGTFAFVGPDVFFQSQDGQVIGTVRRREGSSYPITYPIAGWSPEKAAAFFHGHPGTIMADPSGGKALRLRETTGTVFEHIHRGGPVAYIILGVGLFALGLALHKFIELGGLKVDAPASVDHLLATFFERSAEQQRNALSQLKATTRALFETGLRHRHKPKEVIEEHLFAFTLRTRLQYERRLPLLAVIATASPLMGLLGTVMGMIKTFALITVFGTGNAAKLSSGISEVLVTTELGLVVAIPALILHGFLFHRTQKKLSLLERYAVEFVAAVGDAQGAEPAAEPLASV